MKEIRVASIALAAYFVTSADAMSITMSGLPVRTNGAYNSSITRAASSESTPTMTRSGFMKSSTAAPSFRDSGLAQTWNGVRAWRATSPILTGQDVTRIDGSASMPLDELIIDRAVVGDDHDAVGAAQNIGVEGHGREGNAVLFQRRHVGIVVGNLRTPLLQQPDHVQRGTLADVVDVLLVGDADQQHAAAAHRFTLLVQRVDNLPHPELGHLGIQLAGKLDEAGLVVEGPHLPREVMRIEGNAVPADAGTGRELHEAEWLRRRRLDHFPHVHAELVADDRHLVDEADVHTAESVLQDLDELCRLRGRNRHERVDGRLI